ncbi:PREDICTED: C-C motif chemokine 4-like isoform X1 [Cyprinodon variegatus]|uniref:C-C motif chemokine 4-like isoform X1 n=1 Tax=Cyprinodon variegatus TaxID=28743 RepID=UPI000742AD17|nr:PREDICTED: C-C motif chemokine 4-like isoform X1 [Cyprinodon variegatus]
MMSLNFLLLLVIFLVLPTFSAQAIPKCCLQYSRTRFHRGSLKSYYIQDSSLCTQPAVIFTTIKGKRICVNPSKVWTKTSMAYLDGKNWWQRHTTLKKHQEDSSH